MTIPGYNWLRVSVGVLGVVLASAPALAQNAEGLFVTVPNPITSDAVARIKAQINSRLEGDTPRPKPTVIVFDFNPGGKPAATAEIGACRDLAQLIKSKQGAVNTVAFVHAKVSGHTVLPVLACRELVMSKEAAVGEIAGENVEPLQEPDKGTYQFYFGRDPEFTLVRKMFDRDVQLRRGFLRAKPDQKVYIDARDKEAEKQAGGLEKVAGIPDGQIGLYNRDVARSVNLSKGTAENRTELCETYGLPPSAGRDDPLGGEVPDVYRWKLSKEVDAAMRESVGRVVRDVRKKGGNVLILEIDCTGNDVLTAREIADDLRKAQNPRATRSRSRSSGSFPIRRGRPARSSPWAAPTS